VAPADARFEFGMAEGGRLLASCCCREVVLDVPGMLPGRLFIVDAPPGRLFAAGALLVWPFIVAGAPPGRLFIAGELPGRLFVAGALCDGVLAAAAER
jgi:hypothetical protein